MKFVLAFLLLIGISCQIGRGDCAPADTLLGELKETMKNGYDYVKDTVSQYMPNINVPVPDSLKNGYENMKNDVGSMADGAEKMAKDAVHNIADSVN